MIYEAKLDRFLENNVFDVTMVRYMRPGKGNVSNSWAFELMKMTA